MESFERLARTSRKQKLNYSPISSAIRFDFARFGNERIRRRENETISGDESANEHSTRTLSRRVLAGRVDRSFFREDFWNGKRKGERKKEAISLRTSKWRGIRLSADEVRTRERTAALIPESGSVMAAGVPQHYTQPRDTFNYSSRFLLRS